MMGLSDLSFDENYCYRWLVHLFAVEVRKRNREYEANQEQQEAIANVASWLANSKNHFGLVLNGITGNGKTTLIKAMRSFFNVCKIKDPICEEGESLTLKAGIWFVTSRELYHLYSSNRKRFERCKNTFILAIDDFGTEESDFCQYGNRYKPLEELLSYRYDRMLPTILTTNLGGKAIRDKYGDRLADRFNEMMQVITLPDINFRNINQV